MTEITHRTVETNGFRIHLGPGGTRTACPDVPWLSGILGTRGAIS